MSTQKGKQSAAGKGKKGGKAGGEGKGDEVLQAVVRNSLFSRVGGVASSVFFFFTVFLKEGKGTYPQTTCWIRHG